MPRREKYEKENNRWEDNKNKTYQQCPSSSCISLTIIISCYILLRLADGRPC